jgi:hypothetical protein
MKMAINAARTRLQQLNDNDQTLKVFMAPEFYFRGAGGAYTPDVVSDIVEEMKKDAGDIHGTGHPLFEHWLFIFGTAVCAFEVEGDKAEIHNVALIQKEDDVYTVAKELIAQDDYKKEKGQKVVTLSVKKKKKQLQAIPPQGSSTSGIKSKFDDERMGGCIFTVDGITFGLEVCLDHTTTGRTGQQGGRLAGQCESIQVLLVPSCGEVIGSAGMYCKPNGICFNVNGKHESQGKWNWKMSAEVRVRDKSAGAPKQDIPYTQEGIDGSLGFFGPFDLPPRG